jgi:hypothetical protein
MQIANIGPLLRLHEVLHEWEIPIHGHFISVAFDLSYFRAHELLIELWSHILYVAVHVRVPAAFGSLPQIIIERAGRHFVNYFA